MDSRELLLKAASLIEEIASELEEELIRNEIREVSKQANINIDEDEAVRELKDSNELDAFSLALSAIQKSKAASLGELQTYDSFTESGEILHEYDRIKLGGI
jgi:hypothetical protein